MSVREVGLWVGSFFLGAGFGILLATIFGGVSPWITGVAWAMYGIVVLFRTRYEIVTVRVNVRKGRA